MASPAISSSDAPPRYGWTKRLAVLALLLAVAVGATRWWWGREATARMRAMIDEAHARGEPILPADFIQPPVPDSENAAFYLTRAANAVSPTAASPAASTLTFPGSLPYPRIWHAMADKAFAANAAVYPDVRKARQFAAADWGIVFRPPTFNILLPHLGPQRRLANLMGDTALRAHFKGDDEAALEYVEDVRAISRALDNQVFMVQHFVAIGVDALAVTRLQMMAGGLRIEGPEGPATTPAARPARRAQVTAAIRGLLDDLPRAAARRRLTRSEAMAALDTIRWMTREATLLHPMYELDAIRAARHYDAYVPAAVASSWPAAVAVMPEVTVKDFSRLANLMSVLMAAPMRRAIESDFQLIADRRLAAIALATRLYRVDHGRFPESLGELVPAYLPEVPTDPFSPTGAPFKYILAQNGTRPVAYSVSKDGLDDTPDETVLPANTCWGWQAIPGTVKRSDQHRDLSQWMPATPPPLYNPPLEDDPSSPEAVDDQ